MNGAAQTRYLYNALWFPGHSSICDKEARAVARNPQVVRNLQIQVDAERKL